MTDPNDLIPTGKVEPPLDVKTIAMLLLSLALMLTKYLGWESVELSPDVAALITMLLALLTAGRQPIKAKADSVARSFRGK